MIKGDKMSQAKKISLYELNPRFYKDMSGNGIGDLQGLAAKIDYLKFLGVDGVILQDVLSTDSNDKIQNFRTVSAEIGELNDLVKVLSVAKKNNTKVLVELNIGSIKENHKWFENAVVDKTEEFEDVIETTNKKELDLSKEDKIAYKYASAPKSYYLVDSKTQEIPLNWKSEQVMDQFLKVIRFWRDLGISGFVIKNFEYLADLERRNMMSDATLKEMRKFYRAIKNVEDKIIIVGKSDIIETKNASQYTTGITQVLDYFMSTKTSLIGTKDGDVDFIGKFKIKQLVCELKKLGHDSSNIISFGSAHSGRIVSRWANDNQYHQESAKALAMLLHLSNASSSIYYGDEIGAKNIGLTHLDDFQDKSIIERKKSKVTSSYTEEEFMDAQVLQNPINSRSLMAWNDQKNGGFSNAEKTITPASSSYGIVNVEVEYSDKNSILNFNKELLKLVNDSSYSPIIAHGKFKISSRIPGVVKIVIRFNNKEIIALVNTSAGTRPILSRFIAGKVVLSSYAGKIYKSIPKRLDAFEAIIISKHTDEYYKEKEVAKIEAQKEAARIEREKEFQAQQAKQDQQRLMDEEAAVKEAKLREIELIKEEAKRDEQRQQKEAEKIALLKEKEDIKAQTQAIKLAEQTEREAIKIAKKVEQEAARAAARNPEDISRLSDEQVAKTTQVNVDKENIEDFIDKLNKKEK